MKAGETVYLSTENHQVLTFDYADFEASEQNYITKRVHLISQLNVTEESGINKPFDYSNWLLLIGVAMVALSFLT